MAQKIHKWKNISKNDEVNQINVNKLTATKRRILFSKLTILGKLNPRNPVANGHHRAPDFLPFHTSVAAVHLLANMRHRFEVTSLSSPEKKRSNLARWNVKHNHAGFRGRLVLLTSTEEPSGALVSLFPKSAAVMVHPSGALNTSQLVAHPFFARSSLPERKINTGEESQERPESQSRRGRGNIEGIDSKRKADRSVGESHRRIKHTHAEAINHLYLVVAEQTSAWRVWIPQTNINTHLLN